MESKELTITGTSQYGYSQYIEGQKTPKTKVAREKGAFERVYRNGYGLYAPGIQIKGCLLHAASLSEYKIGKSKARAHELIKNLIHVNPKEIPMIWENRNLNDDDLIYQEAPTKVGSPPKETVTVTGVYTVPNWSLTFTLLEVGGVIELEPLIEQLEFGGLVCGIGAKRTWGWGRFVISTKEG
jgi:hypothetical protein